MRTEEQKQHFKTKLEEELREVEKTLESVGRKNPDVKGDWEAEVTDTDTASTEPDEKADKFEEYEENAGILNELEIRWRNIKRALAKFEVGTYGICEVSGKEIEDDRLEVNPSARTCGEHLEKEKELPL